MKNHIYIIFLSLIIVCLISLEGNAQNEKRAQTGLKFLSVSNDARANGMANANTTLNLASASMFYNPAAMAEMGSYADASFGTTRWIADINYYHASIALRPFDGDFGIIGISFIGVDYGELHGTVFAANQGGYIDVGTFKPNALAFGIGYAKSLSQKFSIGANIKYVRQSLGTNIVDIADDGSPVQDKNIVDVAAFDFGILYHTGFKSLDFGMSVRNFSTEIKYKEENFEIPLTFRIGVSMNVLDLTDLNPEEHSFLLSVDASHPRDFSEQVYVGGEYTFIKTFSLRAGYEFPKDEGGFSAGFGIKHNLGGVDFGIDYAYTDFGIFNDSNNLFGGFNGIHSLTIKFAY